MKKNKYIILIVLTAAAAALYYMWTPSIETPVETPNAELYPVAADAKTKAVLVVNFNLQDMSLEQYAALGTAVVPEFAPGKIDGLIGKTFISNVEKGVFGGVYYFTTNETMSGYLESDLWKGIEANENLVNFTKDTFSVASISQLSNGYLTFL